PGIGAEWFSRWGNTDLSGDFITINGQKRAVPRYYQDKMDEAKREAFKQRSRARALQKDKRDIQIALQSKPKKTSEREPVWMEKKRRDREIIMKRRETRAEITRLRQQRLKRELE